MNQDIVQNHAAISSIARAFLDYAVTQGNCLQKASLLDDSLPPLFRGYRYPLHSWPWFLGEQMRQKLEECVCLMPGLVQRALKLEFGNDHERLGAYFNMHELLARLYVDTPLDVSQLMQRTDAMLTQDGLKIMEINVGSNIGGWQIQWMDGQYRKHASLQPFFEQVDCQSRDIPLGYMTYIVENASTVCDHAAEEIHAFTLVHPEFFEFPGGQGTIGDVFQAALKSCGRAGAMHFGISYDELTFSAAGAYLNGQRITAVVSTFQGQGAPEPPQMLYRSYLTGRVAWPDNPFIGTIGDKRSLALLHKYKHDPEFNDQERALIDYFIPWGTEACPKQVEFKGRQIDLETLLLQEREQFVVKIAIGAQGDDVNVGKYKSDAEWSTIVRRAMSEPGWLVQEFCSSLPFYGQSDEAGYGLHDVIWGVFGFGRKYGGCWLRLMKRGGGDGIINSAKGAQETIVYEVAG
jgi:hypothetical protein